MSYSLIYDKQFVKVTDNLFIPMILAGDNNCYEAGYGNRDRRARSWQNFSHITKGNIAGTLEMMLEVMEKERQRQIDYYKDSDYEYTDAGFGSWSGLKINGSTATFGTYTGVAKTGCKKALTIEQLKSEGIGLNIHTYYSDKTKESLKEQGLEPVNFIPKDTEDLLNFIENVAPKYKGKKEGALYVTFSGMSETRPKWLRAKYFKKEKKTVEKKEVLSRHGYAIRIIEKESNSTYGYLVKYHGGTFTYTQSKTGAKQFIDKNEAERWMNKIAKRRSLSYGFEVIIVDYGMERRFLVPADKKITLPEPEPEKPMTDEELIASLSLRKEGEEIANMFDPEQKCFLDPLGVALHDFIKGCELTQKYDKMQQALGIFRENYPEEYMTLLD